MQESVSCERWRAQCLCTQWRKINGPSHVTWVVSVRLIMTRRWYQEWLPVKITLAVQKVSHLADTSRQMWCMTVYVAAFASVVLHNDIVASRWRHVGTFRQHGQPQSSSVQHVAVVRCRPAPRGRLHVGLCTARRRVLRDCSCVLRWQRLRSLVSKPLSVVFCITCRFHSMVHHFTVSMINFDPFSTHCCQFYCTCASVVCAIVITGSIARGANLPVFSLLRGRFWGFSPHRGDTLHRLGWKLAWRRGPKVASSMPNFTPIGATTRV